MRDASATINLDRVEYRSVNAMNSQATLTSYFAWLCFHSAAS